jgi:chaperonin cofactor prefoldin
MRVAQLPAESLGKQPPNSSAWEAIMLGASLRSKIVEFPNTNGVAAKLDGNGQSDKAIGDDKKLVADAVEKHPPDIETHANRLLNLLNELRCFADQACDAVLREPECAAHIEETIRTEINGLLDQIKEKDESLQAREVALAKLEETSKAKFAELESQIRDQESQLENWEIQSQHLVSERDFLVSRLKEAELAAEQAEAKAREFTERMEAELNDLRLQLAKREESLAARDLALSRFEGDLRTHIQNLQLRLQGTADTLHTEQLSLKIRRRRDLG